MEQNKIASFSPWLKYYDQIFNLISHIQMLISNGGFESAIKHMMIVHDTIDMSFDNKLIELETQWVKILEKATKELAKQDRYLSSFNSNNRIDKIELYCLELHKILQYGMYLKGMKYSEKTLSPTEWDEDEFLRGSDL